MAYYSIIIINYLYSLIWLLKATSFIFHVRGVKTIFLHNENCTLYITQCEFCIVQYSLRKKNIMFLMNVILVQYTHYDVHIRRQFTRTCIWHDVQLTLRLSLPLYFLVISHHNTSNYRVCYERSRIIIIPQTTECATNVPE